MFCLTLCCPLFAQNYDIKTMEVNNNNYSAYLNKILFIDSSGFLWYSTYNGLVREMGNQNSIFFKYSNSEEVDVIGTNALFETSNNRLIACTANGINILNLNTKSSHWVEVNNPDTNNQVSFSSVKEDFNGNLWLGTYRNRLYCYTNNNELININFLAPENSNKTFKKDPFGNDSYVEVIEVLEDNSVIIKKGSHWFQIKNGLSYYLFTNTRNTSTLLVTNGKLFPTNSSGEYTYNNNTFKYNYLKNINKHIVEIPYYKGQLIPNGITKNFYNELNLITLDGMNLVGFKLDTLKAGYELKEVERFAFKRNINNALYDKRGYFWAQSELGISKIRYSGLGFKKFLDKKSISCRTISQDTTGTITVQTYSGLFEKKQDLNQFNHVKISNKNKKEFEHIKALAYGYYRPNDNEFYFYGYHGTLLHYNVLKDKFIYHTFNTEISNILDLIPINDSTYLLATSHGIFEYDINTKFLKNISKLSSTIDLTNVPLTRLYIDRDKATLWISSTGPHALIKKNLITGEITSFNKNDKVLPLLSNTIKVIHEDSENNIWLGSEKGLQKVDPQDLSYKNHTIKQV